MDEDIFSACARTGSQGHSDGSWPMSTPIVQASAFGCDDLDVLGEIQRGERSGFQYTRISNPTTAQWENEVAALEGAEAGLACASGMGAIAAVLLGELTRGDHIIVAEQVYGVTYAFVTQTLARFGVSASFVDVMDVAAVAAAFTDRTRLIYVETISNPTLLRADLRSLAELAHARGALLVVDNTFATPFFAQPLASGADIVLHSATKYLNGHSDVSAGIVVASRAVISHLQKTAWLLGATLDPMASWLLLRGLKTFALRMQRQSATAVEVAQVLRPRCARVYHSPASAIVSFEPRVLAQETPLAAAKRVVKALKNVAVVPSLGGCSTTITHPASTSHRSLPEAMRARLGVGDALLRLSVGLEDPALLRRELEAAL